MPTTEDQLTARQADVLRLHREGKNPTEIGRTLGISSQGVHGHLARLRQYGLIAGEGGTTARSRTRGRQAPYDPSRALDAVRQAVREQEEAIIGRQRELDAVIATAHEERDRLNDTLDELRRFYAPQVPEGSKSTGDAAWEAEHAESGDVDAANAAAAVAEQGGDETPAEDRPKPRRSRAKAPVANGAS